jgi:hypothetical protein
MKFTQIFRACALSVALGCASLVPPASAAESDIKAADMERDGRHDFDFDLGVWKTHIKRRLHPLTDSIELNGTVSVRKVWDGRAQLEEIEADGPKGHWQGMSLFLYNPAAHQWSQSFIGSAKGTFSNGLVGAFKEGRGELFAQDTLDGRSILVRGVWSDITPTSHRYEESYSADGGKNWEPELSANLTKAEQPVAPADNPGPDASHDFDFDFGNWHTHSSRLLHPLTGSKDWIEMDGTTKVSKIWGGRANLAEFKGDGPKGPLELLALRIYNPTTKQWSLNFATPSVGTLGDVPGVGEFRNGRADFYDQEPFNGKAVLLRFSIWGITPDTAQSEQAFSADGGKTWEVNWINRYTRIKS